MKKKVRRVVLGEGYPWYLTTATGILYSGVRLYKSPLATSILTRDYGQETVALNLARTGNWNKIRLVAEVLE